MAFFADQVVGFAVAVEYDVEHTLFEHGGRHGDMTADQGLHLRVARETLGEGGVKEIGRMLLKAQVVEVELPEEEIVDDFAGPGKIGDEGLAPGLVGGKGNDFRIIETAVEPVYRCLVDPHVQIVFRNGTVFGQYPGDNA